MDTLTHTAGTLLKTCPANAFGRADETSPVRRLGVPETAALLQEVFAVRDAPRG